MMYLTQMFLVTSFCLHYNFVQDGDITLPEPLTENITTREQPGNEYGVIVFNGEATDEIASQKLEFLKQQLAESGISFDQQHWILARYNDPSTKPRNRRNEILIPLKSFNIWKN